MTRPQEVDVENDQVSPVKPRLRASWVRSEHYGVSLDEVQPPFRGSFDTGSLFYECGHQVIADLHATLAGEPVSLMIADSEGMVLARLCDDTAIVRSLDRVYLAPGFSYAERNAGTNGLGLALADRAPSLVRADEHYCTGLRGYTCAAAPVLDPATGGLAGTVNLTTWSDSSSELLLALAQSAAGNTAALMLARSGGRVARPAPRGEVFHVYTDRVPAPGQCVSAAWRDAVAQARGALAKGRVVAVVGEPGAGKTALALAARHTVRERERRLTARPPAPDEVAAWLTLWTPELAKHDTCVVVSGVDTLPAWAAAELAQLLTAARHTDGSPQPFVLTAEDYTAIPEPLAALADTVVEAPALRYRPDDVLPLAHHFARLERRRAVGFTPAASRALVDHQWPGNVKQLKQVVRDAATRTDVIDTRHLPTELFTGGHTRLNRLQSLERDEIVRCLTEPGTTVVQAAARLGMGRATLYRKMAQYDITVPGRSPGSRT